MKKLLTLLALTYTLNSYSQQITDPFEDCKVVGATVIYDLSLDIRIVTDSMKASLNTPPASTFKILNLLIALETGVIQNELDVVAWPGFTDTVRYGYRPEIYRDMSVKEAFEVSAGWVFIELSKKIGTERYREFLKKVEFGNMNPESATDDFWNFGNLTVSVFDQVNFLIKLVNNNLPFSIKNLEIVKRVMVVERRDGMILRGKTGWTRIDGKDIGWWIGYIEESGHVRVFATRIEKLRLEKTRDFGDCRKSITNYYLDSF